MSIELFNRAKRLVELPPDDDSDQRVWKRDMLEVRQESEPSSERLYICDEFTEEWILFESDESQISISSPRMKDRYHHDGIDHCYAYISPKDYIDHYHDVFSHYYGSAKMTIPDHIVDRFHEIIHGSLEGEYTSPHGFCDEKVPKHLLAPTQALMEEIRALDASEMKVVDLIEMRRAIRGFFRWHGRYTITGVETTTWMNDRYVISFSEVKSEYGTDVFIALDRSSEEYVVIVSSDAFPDIATNDFSWCYSHGSGLNPWNSVTFSEKMNHYHELFNTCCNSGRPFGDPYSEDDD